VNCNRRHHDPNKSKDQKERAAPGIARESRAAKKTFEHSKRVAYEPDRMKPYLRIAECSVEEESTKKKRR